MQTRRCCRTDGACPGQPKPAPLLQVEVVERIPLKGVRGIIADRMGTSVHTTARVTLLMEVDATEFVAMRERLKARVSEEWGFTPGYNDLLAKMVAVSLRRNPYMNARLAADAIEILGHVNLGMAVDTERGLLVPVIRDADQKSLRQFGAEFREMVSRARGGKSLPDDLTGGTFTLTNLGMFDIEGFTPIINLPEAAILGVGRIIPKWVYREESPDAPVLRQMMTLSLVFDHRVVDGAPARASSSTSNTWSRSHTCAGGVSSKRPSRFAKPGRSFINQESIGEICDERHMVRVEPAAFWQWPIVRISWRPDHLGMRQHLSQCRAGVDMVYGDGHPSGAVERRPETADGLHYIHEAQRGHSRVRGLARDTVEVAQHHNQRRLCQVGTHLLFNDGCLDLSHSRELWVQVEGHHP
jgi:hypothetical protein